jgi:hypothetical protein
MWVCSNLKWLPMPVKHFFEHKVKHLFVALALYLYSNYWGLLYLTPKGLRGVFFQKTLQNGQF